jgi:predicted dehydrogenase
MDKLKVGIAGYGVVGKRRRVFIDAHPHLSTVAVSDVSFGGDGVLPDGVPYFDNYHKLFQQELDILFVSLPNYLAANATIAGLEKGLHVFCEKPPGRDLTDIANVIACERRHPGLKLKYGFNHRYHDSVREALRIVKGQELGPVINMRGVYGKSSILSFASDWRTKRDLAGGGILLDQGIHMVDLMRLFGGEFTQVYSFVSNNYWHHDVEDNAYALMRNKDGVVAMLHSSATQWRHRFQLEITFWHGMIVLSGILSGTKSYGAETIMVAYANKDDGGDPLEITTRYNKDNSWRDEIGEFAEAILNGNSISAGSSQDAMNTMRLVYSIYCADPVWHAQYNLNNNVPAGYIYEEDKKDIKG